MKLYEIHISININNGIDEIKWLYFCRDNNYKPIRVLNDIGKHNIQYMISKWCNHNNDKDAIKHANEINKKFIKVGFNVTRIKVEVMMLNKDYDDLVLEDFKNDIYWEIHFKISIKNYEELEKLLNWKKTCDYLNIGLSISSFGEKKYPIITIRHNFGEKENIINYKNVIIDDLKNNGFHITDKIQREISIYDTNPDEDKGWISKL